MVSNAQSTPQERTAWRRTRSTFLGLQSRATIVVVAIVLAVTALTCGLYLKLAQQLAFRLQSSQVIHLAALVARSASTPLEQGDEVELASLTREYAIGDAIVSVVIADPMGYPIVASGPGDDYLAVVRAEERSITDGSPLGRPVLRRKADGTPSSMLVTYPIQRSTPAQDPSQPYLLGYARVALSLDRTMREFAATIDVASGVGITAVLLTIPLAFLGVRRIVVPLNNIRATAARIAAGDLTARTRVSRYDEIGQLANSFDEMASELSRSHDEVVALNQGLEQRVRQRTLQLSELASREPLTGLFNRRHFREIIERRFSESVRYGSDLACMMIDLDDFKTVNDKFGHQQGDQVLLAVAAAISSQLRAADLAARYGGDEFVVLLPQTGADRAAGLADRIARKFHLDRQARFPEVQATLSIGIASLRGSCAETADNLIRSADRALYAAKNRGKDRIELATGDGETSLVASPVVG